MIDKKIIKQESLFDVSSIPLNKKYISPYEKRKWTLSFNKWCEKQYKKYGDSHGVFCCGYMFICDNCKMRSSLVSYGSCIKTIKEIFIKNKKEIPYRNYNFKEIFDEAERLEREVK